MKGMFKVFAAGLLAAASLFASAGAMAQTVVGSDGVKVLGADSLLAVRVNGSDAEALYSAGWQPIAGGATKAAKLIAQCGAACVTVDGSYGISAIAVGRSNGVTCNAVAAKTSVAFSNLGQPIEIYDSCAYWQKVKSLSQ